MRKQLEGILESLPNKSSPPAIVQPVARLRDDIGGALWKYFQLVHPLEIQAKSTSTVHIVVFGLFGDASGSGFGSAIQRRNVLAYRIGIWNYTDVEESSDKRDFTTVVEVLEAEANDGNLTASEVFFSQTM